MGDNLHWPCYHLNGLSSTQIQKRWKLFNYEYHTVNRLCKYIDHFQLDTKNNEIYTMSYKIWTMDYKQFQTFFFLAVDLNLRVCYWSTDSTSFLSKTHIQNTMKCCQQSFLVICISWDNRTDELLHSIDLWP